MTHANALSKGPNRSHLGPDLAAHRAIQAWWSGVALFRQFTHFANLDAQVSDNARPFPGAGRLEFQAH